MPDGAIAVRKGESSFDQLAIDLIKEAELNGICGIGPDGEVAATFCESGSKCPGIGWMHRGSLPCRCTGIASFY
jgi:hypothetical protein